MSREYQTFISGLQHNSSNGRLDRGRKAASIKFTTENELQMSSCTCATAAIHRLRLLLSKEEFRHLRCLRKLRDIFYMKYKTLFCSECGRHPRGTGSRSCNCERMEVCLVLSFHPVHQA